MALLSFKMGVINVEINVVMTSYLEIILLGDTDICQFLNLLMVCDQCTCMYCM